MAFVGLVRRLHRRLRHGCGAGHRKQHIQPGSLAQRKRGLGDLIHRVTFHKAIAEDAVHRPAARIEQAQVIVDFGCRGYRRARVACRVLLLDGDGRRKAIDQIDIGFLNPLEKLPRIGGQRLHIPPLPLGIDSVEGKRTLPRPRYSADHRQLPRGNLAGDVLQVVSPRTADNDGVVQWEGTIKNSSGRVFVSSARLRAQPAILYYRMRCKRSRLAGSVSVSV